MSKLIGSKDWPASIAGNSLRCYTQGEYSNDNSVDLTARYRLVKEMEAKVIKLNDGVGMVSLSYKRMAADRATSVWKKHLKIRKF